MQDRDAIEEKCRSMSIKDLLRATTTDTSDYEDLFLEIAQVQLTQEWHKAQEFKDSVCVRLNDQAEATMSAKDAISKLDEDIDLWHAWIFINCLDDLMLLQRVHTGWAGHSFEKSAYSGSFRAGTTDNAKQIVRLFLELGDFGSAVEEEYDLSDWLVLAETNSSAYVEATVERLSNRGIQSTVGTRILGRLFQDDEPSSAVSFLVLVPEESSKDAQIVLDEIQEMIRDLHAKADQLSEQGQTEEELAIYNQVLELVPTDAMASYYKAVALIELGRYEEATEIFILVAAGADSEMAQNVEGYLKETLDKIPDGIPVLHALAHLARQRDDTGEAKSSLDKILSLDQNDALAHLSLGYLYYEDSSDDAQALHHFGEYLRLNPDADDREMIQETMDALK